MGRTVLVGWSCWQSAPLRGRGQVGSAKTRLAASHHMHRACSGSWPQPGHRAHRWRPLGSSPPVCQDTRMLLAVHCVRCTPSGWKPVTVRACTHQWGGGNAETRRRRKHPASAGAAGRCPSACGRHGSAGMIHAGSPGRSDGARSGRPCGRRSQGAASHQGRSVQGQVGGSQPQRFVKRNRCLRLIAEHPKP